MGKILSNEELLTLAWGARERACATYSGFAVGAALASGAGIFKGCNIESSSYGLTCCAERVALFSALAAGERKFMRIAVVADCVDPCPPCGACLQLLSDYASGIEVIMGNKDSIKTMKLSELLPHSFGSDLLPRSDMSSMENM